MSRHSRIIERLTKQVKRLVEGTELETLYEQRRALSEKLKESEESAKLRIAITHDAKMQRDAAESERDLNASEVIRLQTDVAELRGERDSLAAKLERATAALKDAGETIHDEFCSGDTHHRLHQRVLDALKEIEE